MRVDIVDKNVGDDVLLTETAADEFGHYSARFDARSLRERDKAQPDLQARVYVANAFLAASDVRYNATNDETLVVKLPPNSAASVSTTR